MKVLVSGGHGGIGSAVVAKYSSNGCNVYAPKRDELEMSSDESINNYFDSNDDFDAYIHCVGVNNPVKFDFMSMDDYELTMDINTTSSVKVIRKIIPKMKEKKFGRIILVSSLWSKHAKKGRIAYSMSKSAIDALTRGLAVEYGGCNILINSIVPGFIDTRLTRKNLSKDAILDIENNTPVKRLGDPGDIAEVAYFLTGKRNNFITGQSIVVDGGYSL